MDARAWLDDVARPLTDRIATATGLTHSTVVAALLIAFSVLLAGIIGFGRKKEE